MQLPQGRNLIVLLTAIVALVVPVILLENSVLRHTAGNIVFPLDNAFVDITVARNLAFYQVWGVSKYAFQSASSSLLYPVLLAPVFFIIGSHLIIPIILNGLAALVFLFVLQRALIRRGIRPAVQLVILLSVIFLAPLPLLVVSGMGYTLQLLFCFLFIEALATAIASGETATASGEATTASGEVAAASKETATASKAVGLPRRVYVYGVLMVAARYEDVVLLALACLLLILVHRRGQALRLAAISLSPAILFGVISLVKGNYFLPNSLLLGPYPGFVGYLALAALVVGCLLIRQYGKLATEKRAISVYRLSFALLAILALPFVARNLTALRHFQQDSVRIYEQQFPLAAFVHRYYRRSPVGVNDIGAVAYFSDGKKLDFTGIASADVARSRTEHSWSPVLADSFSRKDGVPTVMVSDPWFTPEQFPRWGKVASWKLPDSQYSTGRTLSFYVTNQRDTTWILRCLHDYEQLLPHGVAVEYYY